MASAVVTARIKDPTKTLVDGVLAAAGVSPNALIGALYAWIAETGEIPEGCVRRLGAKPASTLDQLKELQRAFGAQGEGSDLTPSQMREVLYG